MLTRGMNKVRAEISLSVLAESNQYNWVKEVN